MRHQDLVQQAIDRMVVIGEETHGVTTDATNVNYQKLMRDLNEKLVINEGESYVDAVCNFLCDAEAEGELDKYGIYVGWDDGSGW